MEPYPRQFATVVNASCVRRSAGGHSLSTTGCRVAIHDAAARRDDAIALTERRPDRHEMRVTVEADVDAFGGIPELIEAGVEVEIDANRDRFRERRIGEHA